VRFRGLLGLYFCISYSACVVPYEVITSLLDGGGTGQSSSLSASEEHTCAVSQGALWCWGANDKGQLGDGTNNASLRPKRIGNEETWVKVRCGTAHTCALKADGSVWCWGSNTDGELGQGDVISRASPTRVPLAFLAIDIESRSNFACGLLSDQSLWCWGDNLEGQLGLGSAQADELKPRQVPLRAGCASMALGQGHSCVILSDGALWCWGRNSKSHLGIRKALGVQFRSPQAIGNNRDWLAIDANQEFTCAIKADRSLWCWGGLPGGALVEEPKLFDSGPFTSVRTNTFHACAISLSGVASCWGRNIEGQLGLGDFAPHPNPAPLLERPIFEIAAGRFHTCQRRANESIWCSGANDVAQLGLGDTLRRSTLSEVRLIP
jgi:alpha-tubulin suppressor-like RCC1 family protein